MRNNYYQIKSDLIKINGCESVLKTPTVCRDMAGNSSDDLNLKSFMKKLVDALEQKDLSIADVFSQMDTDDDGQINGPELYKGLNKIAGEILSPGQISEIIKAFDTDDDNRIDLYEFRSAIESHKSD